VLVRQHRAWIRCHWARTVGVAGDPRDHRVRTVHGAAELRHLVRGRGRRRGVAQR
jgi:hypothetical protein